VPDSGNADAAGSSAVKGRWSHVPLLDIPVMKCEHKTNRQTQQLLFQQVVGGGWARLLEGDGRMMSGLAAGGRASRDALGADAASGRPGCAGGAAGEYSL
jgi:hypothetical protein